MVAIPSTQALENYQTTTNWFTQTRNALSSQELNKSYSFNYSTYSSSLFSERVAGSIAKIITSANQLHASAESFRSADTALLNNRIVASSDNTSVTAKADKGTDLKAVEVSVQSLATTQTNSGAAFNADSTTVLQTGTQKFAITTGNKTTEVSFYANSEYTHQTVLNLIKDAISKSESGVSAKIVKDSISSNLHLELTSKDTGTTHAFTITDVSGKAISSTGIQSITTVAADATYRVNNGSLRTSSSNQINLDNGNITATLLKPTTRSVSLTSKPDSDAIVKQTNQIVKDYNELQVQISDESSFVNPAVKRNLDNALKSSDLDTLGISKRANGTLALDEIKLHNHINAQFDQVSRSLNGSTGVTSALTKVTERLQNSPTEALLNQNSSEYKQYNIYQETLEFYSQLPKKGLVLNNFL